MRKYNESYDEVDDYDVDFEEGRAKGFLEGLGAGKEEGFFEGYMSCIANIQERLNSLRDSMQKHYAALLEKNNEDRENEEVVQKD